MRTGNELLQATKPFVDEDRALTWRLLLGTLLLVSTTFVGTVVVPWLAAKLALGALLGLLNIRLFIFFHDYLHGAILQRSRVGSVLMSVLGFYHMAVRSVWRETHNYHHKNNAKLTGSSIGSFPVVSRGMWKGMSQGQRLGYRVARHPLTIFGGYFTVFLIGMTFSPFRRDPRRHWGGPVAVLAHVAAIVALTAIFDFATAFAAVMLPQMVAMALGSYLFYAQHNFPDMKLRGRREWDYTSAALNSSSYFEMGSVLNWLTGNIAYHHVHHLNHRIPFYRLPEAMASVLELQRPGRTSWRARDVVACLSLGVWDPEAGRMLTWSELRVGDRNEGAALAEAAE